MNLAEKITVWVCATPALIVTVWSAVEILGIIFRKTAKFARTRKL